MKGKGSHKNICVKKEDKFQPRERIKVKVSSDRPRWPKGFRVS